MTTAEREMLLKLWDDCPDTKPKELDCFAGKWEVSVEPGDKGSLQTIHDDYAAAIARDAMVQFIVNHSHDLHVMAPDGYPDVIPPFAIKVRGAPMGGSESLLAALIVTCRMVAGKEDESVVLDH